MDECNQGKTCVEQGGVIYRCVIEVGGKLEMGCLLDPGKCLYTGLREEEHICLYTIAKK